MSRVCGVDCLSPLYLNPPVWSPWAWDTSTRAVLGILRVVDGSITRVAFEAPMKSPSSQPTLSSRIALRLWNGLQPLYSVYVEEGFSFGLPTYHLWNRADDCRTKNYGLRFCQPYSRWLVRNHRQASFVAKVAVDHCENPFPNEPLQHVKDSWGYRGHVFSTREEALTVAIVFP